MSDDASATFAGIPSRSLYDLSGVTVGIIGIQHASPYEPGVPSHSADAPSVIRAASDNFKGQLKQLDFDVGATLVDEDGRTNGIFDCGDLALDLSDAESNRQRITAAARGMLEAGVVPVVLGGDDSVPIPVLGAYEGRGPITIVQIDAHVDWGDVIQGNPYGYGSTMRRAAEYPWVAHMIQVGIRGYGSGVASQINDARAWGSQLVTGTDFRRLGVAGVLNLVPAGIDVVFVIDLDGLDPVLMPGVAMRTPGGLDYQDMLDLLHGVAAKARIVGANIVEFVPDEDPDGIGALIAARLTWSAAGIINVARQGQ